MTAKDGAKRAEQAGYMESKVPFSCGNCDWVCKDRGGKAFCFNPEIMLPVDPVYGCCNHFVNEANLLKAAAPVWFVGEPGPRKV
jgi:hypothetical protein